MLRFHQTAAKNIHYSFKVVSQYISKFGPIQNWYATTVITDKTNKIVDLTNLKVWLKSKKSSNHLGIYSNILYHLE